MDALINCIPITAPLPIPKVIVIYYRKFDFKEVETIKESIKKSNTKNENQDEPSIAHTVMLSPAGTKASIINCNREASTRSITFCTT